MESDEMRWSMDKSSSLGMPMSPQEISKRYKRQRLGMPRGTPSSSAKIRSPFKTLYFYCFVFYAFLEKMHSIFHLPRTLYFSLLSFNECSLFLELHLAFVFCLDFCSDLVISLHEGVFRPLVYVGFHQKSCFKKVWMVLEKGKKIMPKVVQKGACLDYGLDFCMSCLMSF
jgi:hypothetical protein